MQTSTIELKWKDRQFGKAQTPRRFLDVVIDGQSLYELLNEDKISPIGWSLPVENERATNRFLLVEPADLPNDRRSIYVCPECADLGCGAVSAIIEEQADKFVWSDFGYQNNYDDDVYFEGYEEIGPFIFDRSQYESIFRSAIEFSNEQ
jgi:hypothetical protein